MIEDQSKIMDFLNEILQKTKNDEIEWLDRCGFNDSFYFMETDLLKVNYKNICVKIDDYTTNLFFDNFDISIMDTIFDDAFKSIHYELRKAAVESYKRKCAINKALWEEKAMTLHNAKGIIDAIDAIDAKNSQVVKQTFWQKLLRGFKC